MENGSGLLVNTCLTPADGHAERVAALHMIEPYADRPGKVTLGGDKAYDAEDFVNELLEAVQFELVCGHRSHVLDRAQSRALPAGEARLQIAVPTASRAFGRQTGRGAGPDAHQLPLQEAVAEPPLSQ